MRFVYTLFIVLGFATLLQGQSYTISTVNGQTINTCSGIFYDSGGPGGVYGNNQNFTVTFCPGVTNQAISINFTQWQVGAGDQLCVFDGNSTSAPALGCFNNATPASVIGATTNNTSGCVTLTWTSNATNVGQGWAGVISCVFPCQTIIAQLQNAVPNPVPAVNGYIDICPGEVVTFFGQGSYPQNNTYYNQSNATSTFVWTIEGQQFSGQSVNHVFNAPGGYRVQLEVTDTEGCTSTNLLNQRVRVAPEPHFAGTSATNNTVCIGDTVTLQGFVTQPSEDFAPPLTRGDSLFLPDGSGVCYSTSLSVADFLPGQTVTNAFDIIDICVNMEHSYMGDLDISITCPTGQTVTLHNYPGGGGTYLGVPIDIDSDLSPGLGFDYCWAENAPNGTWTASSIGVGTLPAGTYTPDQSFNGFTGCELNGDWTITICDNLAIDNGYIFNWGINFAPSLYPALETFTPQITSKAWQTNSSIVTNVGDTVITVVPSSAGTGAYTFSMSTDFGCTYDTTINITVLPFTDPNCLNCDSILPTPQLLDTTVCQGQSVPLDATVSSNLGSVTYTYISGATIPTGTDLMAELAISGITPNVVNINTIESVCINVNHPFLSDVDVFLQSPSGQILELTTDNGGSGDNYTNTCFSPTATVPITSGSPPYTGTFLPEGNWNNLLGSTSNGTWILRIQDDSQFFDGVLDSWSITFANPHNISYSWSPTSSLTGCVNCPTPTATPPTTTNYVVTVSDNYNCVQTDTATITVIPPLAAPTVVCGTTTATSIQITWNAITGAVGYEVNINNAGWIPANGVLSHTVTGLAPNQTVQFSVRAINGLCDDTNGIGSNTCTTLPCALLLSVDSTNAVSCFNGNNGSVFLSTTGSTPPLTYTVNGISQNNGNFTGLSTGMYQATVQDAFGCTDTISFNITQPNQLIVTVATQAAACFGTVTGQATVNVLGGTAPYTYNWNNGQNTANNTNLLAGNYIVTVTDANGCTAIASGTVTQPTQLTLSTTKTDVTCFGGNNGTATVIPSGGTPNYSYVWNTTPVQTTSTATSLSIGTYLVTVTDANGCSANISVTINQPTPIQLTADSTDANCFGANDGTATVTAIGGVGNYTYTWSTTPTQNTATAVNLTAGIYTVTVTDGNGCTETISTSINEPPQIQLSFSNTQVTCFGLFDGTATVTASGGVGSVYSYAWNTNPAQNLATATNLSGGFYEVTVTDSTNCSVSDTVFVFAPVIINVDTLGATPVTCFGGNDGTVFAQGSGGTGQKSYRWNTNPIQFGTPINNLQAGTYSVTITDVQGCAAIDSITVLQPDPIQATYLVDSLTCFQNGTGAVTISTTGGTPPHAYLWEDGQIGNFASALNSGFFTVTITDSENCTQIDSVFIPEPLPLTMTFTSTQVSCNGAGDGTATVFPSGGTPNYSWQWENGQINIGATGLNGGFESITVTDANGCIAVDSVSILERPALTVTDVSTQVSCFGNNDGTATITPTGGSGTYSYLWNNNQTNSTATGLSGGMYYYTVTDSDNCSTSDSVFVLEPQPLSLSLASTPVSCFGGLDGTASVTPSGGTSPYFYQWSNSNQTNPNIFGLTAGWATVTVTDVNNCTLSDSVFVVQLNPLQSSITTTPALCNGSADGTAAVIVTGGVGNYTYDWLGTGQNNDTAVGLIAGTYIVMITDSNGCMVNDTAIVTEPTGLTLSMSATDASCFGAIDGTVSVSPSGGTMPYSYQWSSAPTDTNPTVTNLLSGIYTVTVTDGNGCQTIDSVFVGQPTEIFTNMSATPVNCNAGNDGTATVIASGGTSPYSYLWSSTSTLSTASNLTTGWYTVTVTDANNCTVVDSVLVQEPSALATVMTQQAASCFGYSDGEAYVTVSGGVPNYTYLWSTTPTFTTDTVTDLKGGTTYFVTVTDNNGCAIIDSVTINQPPIFSAQINATNETCDYLDDGTATAVITGGTGPFVFAWNDPLNQNTSTAINLSDGFYQVSITDANGCLTFANTQINEPNPLALSYDLSNVNCFGESTGMAVARASGGTPSYSFEWSTNAGTVLNDTVVGLTAGLHFLTLTDTNNCVLADTIEITEPAAPLDMVLNPLDVTCFGDFDGRIETASTGGTAPYVFSLDGQNFTTSPTFIGLNANNYEVTIRDANGCEFVQTTTLNEPPQFSVELGESPFIEYGESLELNPILTNGIAPFIYVWSPIDSFLSCVDCLNPTVEGLPYEKRYNLFITDANGCTAEDFLMVRVRKTRNVFIGNAFTPNDDGNNDYLFVQGDEQAVTVRQFRVYDRWGELVFEVENVPVNDPILGGWDGTFNGQPMNMGTFAWYAEVEFIDGYTEVYKGSAFLVR